MKQGPRRSYRNAYIMVAVVNIYHEAAAITVKLLLSNCSEKAVLAITLCNAREEVLGHAAFFDYPNLLSVERTKWEAWFQENYDSKCTALNTLFLSYFVAQNEYSHGCAKEIIRTMFNAVPDIHYCFLVVPTGVFPGTF